MDMISHPVCPVFRIGPLTEGTHTLTVRTVSLEDPSVSGTVMTYAWTVLPSDVNSVDLSDLSDGIHTLLLSAVYKLH